MLDGMRLRGSMDVVEKHQSRGALRITDHKTGRAPADAPLYVGRGAFLQPLLYALAAEQLFGEKVECGRLFYCTQRGNYDEYELPLCGHGARAGEESAGGHRPRHRGRLPARGAAEGHLRELRLPAGVRAV